MGEVIGSLIIFAIIFGVTYFIVHYARMYGDPISAFANTNFKMKLDKRTGMFWAKPKHGVQPPSCCPECVLYGSCFDGKILRPKMDYVLVNCPRFKLAEGHKGEGA